MSESVTSDIMLCYDNGSITSTSAMVFMAASELAAEASADTDLSVGLHLNLTTPLTGQIPSLLLRDYQQQIASFLLKNKFSRLLYNPLLRRQFEYVYQSQFEEYLNLYGKEPTHIDGHHHAHLCTNMLVDRIIPYGMKVRRNFTFDRGEKGLVNRYYRRVVDAWLAKSFTCVDYFFGLKATIEEPGRLKRVVRLSESSNVELMVHPGRRSEFVYLMSVEYMDLINRAIKISYEYI